MATILAVHNHTERMINALDSMNSYNSVINDVKYNRHSEAYDKLESHHNWKSYYHGIGAAISGITAIVRPELGNPASIGIQILGNFQEAHISRTQGDIETIRRLLDEMTSRRRQLQEVQDQVIKSADRILEALKNSYHSAPVA